MESKLANLPHILWINLDRSIDRKNYMETETTKYQLQNTRISGCDGKQYETFCITNDTITDERASEYGCLCSHFKAIEYFVYNMTDEYCLIAEDDLSFEYVQYWQKGFWEYIAATPKEFEVLQMCISGNISKLNLSLTITVRKPNEWGTVVYLLKRNSAIKLLASVIKEDNKYILFNKNVSDKFIYEKLVTYNIPLFTYHTCFDSNIHQTHLPNHIKCKNMLTNLWMKASVSRQY